MQVRDEDLVDAVAATLLSIWRFQKFTESRWLTVGTATRVLVRAVLLGLDAFYDFLQKDSASVRGWGQTIHTPHVIEVRIHYTRSKLCVCASICFCVWLPHLPLTLGIDF